MFFMNRYVLKDKSILDRLINVLTNLPITEKPWEVIIQEYKPKRTLEQNAKWHAMIRDLAQELGYDPKQMKNIVKDELGYSRKFEYSWIDSNGNKKTEVSKLYARTSKMKIDQLNTLIEQTYQLAAEQGVILQ